MAAHFGAHVIGTVSTPEKAELAKKNGAEIVVVGGKESELIAAVSDFLFRSFAHYQTLADPLLLTPGQ
jgi:NADPH:quinone reductase-like Zn-dependent oxidoreductase